jgi:hypothetical protein
MSFQSPLPIVRTGTGVGTPWALSTVVVPELIDIPDTEEFEADTPPALPEPVFELAIGMEEGMELSPEADSLLALAQPVTARVSAAAAASAADRFMLPPLG